MKPKTRKSDHKHVYELVPLKEIAWFTHEKKCIICGHVNNRIHLDDTLQEGEQTTPVV